MHAPKCYRPSLHSTLHPPTSPPPPPHRQLPSPLTNHLPLAKRPEINPDAHQIIYPRIRPLVQQQRRQRTERIHHQPRLHAAVEHRPRDEGAGVFPPQREEAEEEVEGLQDREGLYGGVEGLGQEVPEDFGPEIAV